VSDNSATFLGGDSCWALEETPRAVDDEVDAVDDTTKEAAEGTRAATVTAMQATDVVFMVLLIYGSRNMFYASVVVRNQGSEVCVKLKGFALSEIIVLYRNDFFLLIHRFVEFPSFARKEEKLFVF